MSAIHGTWSDNCRFKKVKHSWTIMIQVNLNVYLHLLKLKKKKNNSIMFKNFEDTNLGIWSAQVKEKFILPMKKLIII